MTAGCAACGHCCDPVFIDFDVWTQVMEKARRYDATEVELGDNWDDHLFIAGHMRPVGASNGQVMLKCRFYDRDHQACGAYEKRPPLCRGYPWYGDDPVSSGRAANHMYRQCSYLADLPPSERPEGSRPLIPLAVTAFSR
jgi:Fe-S-cluster containining protein